MSRFFVALWIVLLPGLLTAQEFGNDSEVPAPPDAVITASATSSLETVPEADSLELAAGFADEPKKDPKPIDTERLIRMIAEQNKKLLAEQERRLGKQIEGIAKETRTQLKTIESRLHNLESKKAHVSVAAVDNFAVRASKLPDCPKDDQPSKTDRPTKGDAGSDDEDECSACATDWLPVKRVYTTWVTAHKKVKVKQSTPYICVRKEWDEKHCCERTVYDTAYREEEHEVLVPYKKEVIQECVGLQKIRVCLED